MYNPRVIGKHAKRTPIFFKLQTAMSVKESAEKQQEHCKKYDLGLSTKRTGLVHAK